MMKLKFRGLVVALAIPAAIAFANTVSAGGEVDQPKGIHVQAYKFIGTLLPSGQWITPTAAPGSVYQTLQAPPLASGTQLPAGFAQSEVLSPDGKTLLVLISGYNYVVDGKGNFLADNSTQYVFVFDVSTGTPVQTQVVNVSNSYIGIA